MIMMQTCQECGASFSKEEHTCPSCGWEVPGDKPADDAVPPAEEPQIPKQYPKQYPKQGPREHSVFEDKTEAETVTTESGDVIVCPKCGSLEVYLMENRSPTEREKNVLMACTHCRRTFHGPAYYDSKIARGKRGILFFAVMSVLVLAGFGVLLAMGQLTAFLPGTILGGVTLAVSVLGAVLFAGRASHWKAVQQKCYLPKKKGGDGK